jgi:hypothetical protein
MTPHSHYLVFQEYPRCIITVLLTLMRLCPLLPSWVVPLNDVWVPHLLLLSPGALLVCALDLIRDDKVV